MSSRGERGGRGRRGSSRGAPRGDHRGSNRGGAWDQGSRLKPPPAQNEDSVGFVSKGDKTLTRLPVQERFFKDIVDKYLTFCEDKGPDLKKTFLSFVMPESTGSGPAIKGLSSNDSRLSSLVLSMRKLREGLIASGRKDQFAVNAFMFCIRAAIVIKHVDSYGYALQYLLEDLHRAEPLSPMELQEFAGYLVLHQACVLEEYPLAYMTKKTYNVSDMRINDALRAIAHKNYWLFRNTIQSVSLYKARLMEPADDRMRLHTLKCFGKTYFTLPKSYIQEMTGLTWNALLEQYSVGWHLDDDGEKVTIRTAKKAAPEASKESKKTVEVVLRTEKMFPQPVVNSKR